MTNPGPWRRQSLFSHIRGVPRPIPRDVARPEGDRFGQSGAFVPGTAGDVGEELLTASLPERVLLEIEVLVYGRDARVADEHAAVVCVVPMPAVSRNSSRRSSSSDSELETSIEAGIRGLRRGF